MLTLYTLGYQGSVIQVLLETLKANKIKCLIDIRKNPVSRKQGFSKSKLREVLHEHGIEYLHLGDLGVPSAWRKEAKEELITRKKMFERYVKKVLPAYPAEIESIIKLAKTKRSVLLCYEADASDCHRLYLAREIESRVPTKIINLSNEATEAKLMEGSPWAEL